MCDRRNCFKFDSIIEASERGLSFFEVVTGTYNPISRLSLPKPLFWMIALQITQNTLVVRAVKAFLQHRQKGFALALRVSKLFTSRATMN